MWALNPKKVRRPGPSPYYVFNGSVQTIKMFYYKMEHLKIEETRDGM